MPIITRFAQRLLFTGKLLSRCNGGGNSSGGAHLRLLQRRTNFEGTHFRSGALKPKPEETPFGILGVICAVTPGLFVGAAISKSVANFLEENELFVPADDDDDDD